jgi:hypothetical protein
MDTERRTMKVARWILLCTVLVALAAIAYCTLTLGADPVPAPAPAPVPTPAPPLKIELKGPTGAVAPGQLLTVEVDGLTLDQAKKSTTFFYPRNGVTFSPACTWDGKPMLFFSAATEGQYVVAICSSNPDGSIAKVESEIRVGANPPLPPPGPSPVVADQKLWIVIVENTLARDPNREAAETILQQFANQKQDGRYRRLDHNAKDQAGAVPTGIAPYLSRAADGDKLFVVGDDGKILFEGPIPGTPDAAKTLVGQYGG